MSTTDTSGRLFQKYLMEMVKELEWKNEYLANQYEAECDRVYTDRYTSAARKLLEYYSASELKMITDYTPERFTEFLNTAPAKLEKLLRTFYDYEEPNTYYRMLYGKPPLNCEPKYWVLPKINNQWGLSPNEPIHDVSTNILMIIENDGGLDYYKSLIPIDSTFEYVNHMTTKKIYPFVARLAQKFDLLYLPTTELANLSTDFRAVYQQCRDFIVLRYYSEAYHNRYEHYEGMMGLSILFQAIQQMHIKYLDADITRDFYDLDSIRVIYDAYSVPFFENIPTVYHQKIVKLMNHLLMYKGGNQVFFDLCDLFDYSDLQIFKYYLVRNQRFDENLRPVFKYTSPNSKEIDYQATYDVFFAKGTLGGDPFNDITNPDNRLDYNPVTYADPYWVNDSKLLQKIYQTEYNYTETKYIGLQMVFSMTKFLFESGYFIKMIMDNRYKVSMISVSHGKLGEDIDLFTLIVYIHAIIYQKLGYTGNIPSSVDAVGRVIGFNFADDIDLLINDIENNPYIPTASAATILTLLRNMNITDIASCSKVYKNIKELYNVIDNGLLSCKDPEVYFAYKHLYQILLTTEIQEEIFRMSDGSRATSFMELLEDINMALALRIQSLSGDELIQELQYSLIALEKAGDELKYIQSYGGVSGEVISQYLYQLIRVFKSAKVDLVDFKMIYVIDGRCTNLIKLMTRLRLASRQTTLPGSQLPLVDDVNIRKLITTIKEDYLCVDKLLSIMIAHLIRDDSFGISFSDSIKLHEVTNRQTSEDRMDLVDDISQQLSMIIKDTQSVNLTDRLVLVNQTRIEQKGV